jgi:predicted secreted protein
MRALALVAVSLGGLATAGAAGCGGDDGHQVARFDDPRSAIEVGPGDRFEVALASNPGTGYSWRYAQRPAPAVVRVTGARFEGPSDQQPGAGGTEIFSYRAAGAGTTTMRLVYVRPGGGAVGQRRAIRVVVR